ncbi:phosphate ABC transporter permease PstA [soil metagenome]
MSTVDMSGLDQASLVTRQLPRGAEWIVAAAAAAIGGLVLVVNGSPVLAVVTGILTFVVSLPLWARFVSGSRDAVNRLVTALVWVAFAIAMVPLVWLIWLVVSKGAAAISPEFITYSMRSVTGDEQGGLYHALVGTLFVTGIAMVISVPVGIFSAIYLVEYGAGSKMARIITFLVDVMTGIPSIVAGLFAYALFALILGPSRFALSGSIALTLLMIPTVVRSTEEMLKLVPNDLREASFALGVPKWRTIAKMVLPTAIGGIITGVVLAISRVIGETAPLLVAAGYTDSVNTSPIDGSMMTLPVFIYTQFSKFGPKNVEYAWGAALILLLLVVVLNVIARIIGAIFAPKADR